MNDWRKNIWEINRQERLCNTRKQQNGNINWIIDSETLGKVEPEFCAASLADNSVYLFFVCPMLPKWNIHGTSHCASSNPLQQQLLFSALARPKDCPSAKALRVKHQALFVTFQQQKNLFQMRQIVSQHHGDGNGRHGSTYS